MRKWTWSLVAVVALTGSFLGCGGSSNRPANTGSGGAGGTTGAAGTGVAGTTGAAGTGAAGTGAAGDGAAGTGTAGTGNAAAGTTGAAGDGAAGTNPPPPPTYCETHTQRDLPYAIATDFKVVHILNNNNAGGTAWKVVANPTCDATTFPPFTPPASDGGADADGGSDGGVEDGGVDATDASVAADASADAADVADDATVALEEDGGVDAAADVPVDAAAPVDAPVDGGTGDVVVADGGAIDGAVAAPACYEFSYNPADCTGSCWAGSVFQIDDMQPAHPNGVCIKPGAMSVEFWARSSRANARVKFGAIGEGMNSREFFLNITTTWAKYSVSIPAADQSTYNETSDNKNGVWNAFSVVVEPQDHVGGSYILVKDIRWLATP